MYNLPKNVVENGFLSEVYTDRKSLAIIIDRPKGSQLSYDAIRAVQNYLPSSTEVCFFIQEISQLPLTPTTGLYYTNNLFTYKGNVMASSISSVHDAMRSGCGGRIIYYIRDLSDLSIHSEELVLGILGSPEIIKVCASENYKKFIIQNYPSAIINQRIVKDFNISDICEIIFGENDGVQKQESNDRGTSLERV